jgi:hypothetical protein
MIPLMNSLPPKRSVEDDDRVNMNARQRFVEFLKPRSGPVETPLERRKEERRLPCDPSPVRVLAEGHLTFVSGYFLNVSKSGLGLCVDKPFQRGMRVTVEATRLLIRATVRHCTQKANDSFVIGLQIDDVVEIQ